jgi:hypothetical protein
MLPRVDTKSAPAVAAWVLEKFTGLYPREKNNWLPRLFREVADLFEGRHPDYQRIDIGYHDLEHTLQATVCLAELLGARERSGAAPRLTGREFQLAMAAALLHDAGYLKLRHDTQGTGAKYTFCHVLRSCAFAASYLPSFGATEGEVGGVLGAISCTGPTKQISRLKFDNPLQRFIGCALASADYLSQMAAPDYPDELEILYAEFTESDDYLNVPVSNRMFKSAADLTVRTPAFWREVVRPKLQSDFEGAYLFLGDAASGANAYVAAVERNIAIIERRCAPFAAAS